MENPLRDIPEDEAEEARHTLESRMVRQRRGVLAGEVGVYVEEILAALEKEIRRDLKKWSEANCDPSVAVSLCARIIELDKLKAKLNRDTRLGIKASEKMAGDMNA